MKNQKIADPVFNLIMKQSEQANIVAKIVARTEIAVGSNIDMPAPQTASQEEENTSSSKQGSNVATITTSKTPVKYSKEKAQWNIKPLTSLELQRKEDIDSARFRSPSNIHFQIKLSTFPSWGTISNIITPLAI